MSPLIALHADTPLMGTSKAKSAPVCPRCGHAMVPLVYGLPGPDLFDAAQRGEVVLGGCVLPMSRDDEDSDWACPVC